MDWYLRDLASQLNVIEPPCGPLSIDGKHPWPAMKRTRFSADARKTRLHNREVFERLGMAWQLVPQHGKPVSATAVANFPPDLERIERRLHCGRVPHEKVAVPDPLNGRTKEFRFECSTQASAGVLVVPSHDSGTLAFHLHCLQAFEHQVLTLPSTDIDTSLLDELAKAIVGHASHFTPP